MSLKRASNSQNSSMKGLIDMKNPLKLSVVFLLSLLIATAPIYASTTQGKLQNQHQLQQPLSYQDMKQVLKASKQLKQNRKKVGIRLERVNALMAEVIDRNAEFDPRRIREAEQEISDRMRQAIEKFEEKHNVCLVVYHESKKGLENVTDLFIKETFPYADMPDDFNQPNSHKPIKAQDKQIGRFK